MKKNKNQRYLFYWLLLVFCVLCVMILLVFGEETYYSINNNDISEEGSFDASEETSVLLNELIEIDAPFNKHYINSEAKNAWDMIVFDNKLFVGSGDYDSNSGPSKIGCLDLTTKEWIISSVPDDEINRFVIINNTLVAPGVDPIEDWNLGNYYVYRENMWKVKRSIPNGIHNFCMLEYKGAIFCGLGVSEGNYPVAISKDGGESFDQVPFYKNDLPYVVNNSLLDRVYEMFILDDTLYALRGEKDNLELFTYNDLQCRFEYANNWTYKILWNDLDILMKRGGWFSSAYCNGEYYFSTGFLYKVIDSNTIKYINLPPQTCVVDIYTFEDDLYVLGVKENREGEYTSSVYVVDEHGVNLQWEYTDSIYAISFAINKDSIYMALVYDASIPKKSGMIIKKSIGEYRND